MCQMRLQSPPARSGLHISAPVQLLVQMEVYAQALYVTQRNAERRGTLVPLQRWPEPARRGNLLPPPPLADARASRTWGLFWRSGCPGQIGQASHQRRQTEAGIWEPRAIRSCLAPVSCQLPQLSLRKWAWSRGWAPDAPASQQPAQRGRPRPKRDQGQGSLSFPGWNTTKFFSPLPRLSFPDQAFFPGAVVLTLGSSWEAF